MPHFPSFATAVVSVTSRTFLLVKLSFTVVSRPSTRSGDIARGRVVRLEVLRRMWTPVASSLLLVAFLVLIRHETPVAVEALVAALDRGIEDTLATAAAVFVVGGRLGGRGLLERPFLLIVVRLDLLRVGVFVVGALLHHRKVIV